MTKELSAKSSLTRMDCSLGQFVPEPVSAGTKPASNKSAPRRSSPFRRMPARRTRHARTDAAHGGALRLDLLRTAGELHQHAHGFHHRAGAHGAAADRAEAM